jgi:DNA-binding SARP family transcriptional activator
MTRDEIVEHFWPESDTEAAASNLRSTIHAMRRVLEPSDDPTGVAMVYGDRDSVWLRPDVELWVDADEFEHAVEQAVRDLNPLPVLEKANALYRGHYLPNDVFEDWATERRERLKRAWAHIQIRLSRELDQRGDADGAARPLERLLQAEPSDELAARELMQLYARNGRRSEALRAHQRLVQALEDDLGVTPSDETQAVLLRITAGEIATAPAATTFRCAYPFPVPDELVGRDAELDALARILASGRSGGRAALIGAPAGTGKSALVGRIVTQAQAQGFLCLAGGCYEERGAVPLGPFHDALVDYLLAQPAERIQADLGPVVEDLGQVVPELRYHLKIADGGSVPPSIDRIRAFGAIHTFVRTLAERGPVLLCLEDLHAADEATGAAECPWSS